MKAEAKPRAKMFMKLPNTIDGTKIITVRERICLIETKRQKIFKF